MQVRPSIFIVDGHPVLRYGVKRLIETQPDMSVAGECGCINEAIEPIRGGTPDLILLDVDLAGKWASEFLKHPPAGFKGKVLLLAEAADSEEIAGLLATGASGVCSKTSAPDTFLIAIREVLSGKRWVDRAYIESFVTTLAASVKERPPMPVTDRQKEILECTCKGMSNKQISSHLRISETSVKASLRRLFRRYGVETRAQLVATTLRVRQRGQEYAHHG